MLRPYRGSEPFSTTPPLITVDRKKRAVMVVGLPLLLFVGLVGMNRDLNGFMPNGGVRKLIVQCVQNIYATNIQMALDIPRPPSVDTATEIPSGIAICQEWIRREAQNTFMPLYTQEDDSNCLDWSSPHYRVMEIVASSILDPVNGLSRYRHDCFRSRTWDEAVTGMDRTTVQQLLPVARMSPSEELFNTSEFKTQCKVCLDQFDPVTEDKRVKPAAFHHCFTWPESIETHDYTVLTEPGGIVGEKIVIPYNITRPNVAPISSVWKQVRNRLGYVAKIFSNVTNSPPDEHNSGVVIFVDVTSTGIAKTIFPNYFPADVTSITVIASNLCATAYLPTGQLCYQYAEELVTYFKSLYSLPNSGFNGGQGIVFQMTPSSAGLWSRMIRSKLLICLPNSPNCLMPSGSKLIDPLAGYNTSAVVLESAESGKAIDFFNIVGHGDRAIIERLLPADIPATVPKPSVVPQLYTSTGEKVADVFGAINAVTNADGYMAGSEPPPALSQTAAAAVSDAAVFAAADAALPDPAANANIYFPETEEVPTLEYVNAKLAAGEPININYSEANTTKRATDEMVTDVEFGFVTREYTSAVAAEQTALRKESEARIKLAARSAKAVELAQIADGDAPPNLEMEIYCPVLTEDGYGVSYSDGTVKITKNDRIMISDGAGTAIFDKNSMTEETVPIPRDPVTKLPYTHIYDPVTKKNITITGQNITINNDNGVTKRDPVGILFVDNLTDPYTATLITEGGSGNLRAGDVQKKYSGTIISTGPNRADLGDVVRHGRGYAIRKNLEPGQKRTIYGWWNGFYSSQSLSSSESGGSGYEGFYSVPDRPGLSSSDDGGVKTSDSRDMGREIINGLQPKEIAAAAAATNRKLESPIPADVERHLEKYGVGIKVLAREYHQFGEKRVCKNNREKVLAAQKQKAKEMKMKAQLLAQEEAQKPRGTSAVTSVAADQQQSVAETERRAAVEEIVLSERPAPQRRQLGSS